MYLWMIDIMDMPPNVFEGELGTCITDGCHKRRYAAKLCKDCYNRAMADMLKKKSGIWREKRK